MKKSNREFGNSALPDPSQSDFSEDCLSGIAREVKAARLEIGPLDLPTDRPRPAMPEAAMGLQSCMLQETTIAGLRRLSDRAGVQMGALGLAAFAVLLHRYSAQERFIIATVDGSNESLPVVADFSDRPSFITLAQRFEAAIGAPQPEETLGSESAATRQTICQVAFSATALEPLEGLDLGLELSGDELRLHYDQALFDGSTATRMIGHLQNLLAAADENSQTSAAQMPMLSEDEIQSLTMERNDTAREFAVPQRCLHELVEATAARVPNETAVIYGQEQLTYGELNARSNQLAHYLRKVGVTRNTKIGICLNRSLNFAIAILGVLKAGGTCVPLDPAYPEERLSWILEDVCAPIVLTDRGVLKAALPQGTQALHLSQERQKLASESRSNPFVRSNPSDIAYVIYTSGSTGRPRGVLLRHSGLANYSLAAAEMFALRYGDRVLQFCSISFDAALEEIFSTWTAGATLVFRRDDISLEPSEMLAWISTQQISVLDLPTAYWHEWVYALPSLAEKVPSELRLVIVGGEKASADAFCTWHKVVGGRVRWINTYGPAEASIVALTYEPHLGTSEIPAVLPIGRPVANTRVYLLDPYLNPVPPGVTGEIYIAGAGVAHGYLNLPELTEQKFIPEIFSDDPLARMYKTGDLGRYAPSGEIEFMGRRDNQVKIRGFRIEPGEIESVIAQHPGVQQAAVVVHEDSPGNKRLVSFVVLDSPDAATRAGLRAYIRERLPEYMIPSDITFLDAMPLTPNGKIDRRALANLPSDLPSTNEKTFLSDPLQAQLIEIWEELLGRKPIGIRDNFFDLGGHSLLAARLMHRLRQLQGKTIPLAALVQAPTIEKLAAALRNGWSHCWNSLIPLQPDGSESPFFCVHGVGGNVVGFHELARRMRPDYPFYGLQSQGLDGQHPCLTTIQDMAAHYIDEIRHVQPSGPYHLGGFSLGGLVAYEMAQQLTARGEVVELLVLLDTYARNPKPVSVTDLLRNPKELLKLPTEIRRKIRRTLLFLRLPDVLKNVIRTNGQAAGHYKLRPYSGRAVLLRAADALRVSGDPYGDWHRLVEEFETIEIQGAHMDILREPNVRHLAETLKKCIGNASLQPSEFLVENVG